MIQPSLNDQLLRRRLTDQINSCENNVDCLREAAMLMVESYIQARVAAKYLGQEAARNLGTLGDAPTFQTGATGQELD